MTKNVRIENAEEFKRRFPKGEAKTIYEGIVPFWRCRKIKGFGSWMELPKYAHVIQVDE